MKSCPGCHRTFEDTLTYCLVDGSILSAPFDPQATIRIPEVRQTDSSPTEVITRIGVPHNAELHPGWQASPLTYNPNVLSTPSAIPEQKPPKTLSQTTGLWVKLILAIIFAPVLSLVMTFFVAAIVVNLTESEKILSVSAVTTLFLTLVIQLILIYRWWRRKRREI
jgi:hypothetical protein